MTETQLNSLILQAEDEVCKAAHTLSKLLYQLRRNETLPNFDYMGTLGVNLSGLIRRATEVQDFCPGDYPAARRRPR